MSIFRFYIIIYKGKVLIHYRAMQVHMNCTSAIQNNIVPHQLYSPIVLIKAELKTNEITIKKDKVFSLVNILTQ